LNSPVYIPNLALTGIAPSLAAEVVNWGLSAIVILSAFVFSWINLFVGIGILTVLYGHLREGRPL